jgi:hypothetical protein
VNVRKGRIGPALVPAIVLLALSLSACARPTPFIPPTPSPTPQATAPDEPPWDAHLVVEREFPDEDGALVPCAIHKRVVLDGQTAGDDAQQRLDAAIAHLVGGDWSTIEVSLDAMPADEQAARREQGVTEPRLYAMVLTSLISDDFTAHGLLGTGVSTETFVHCDS